jgi:hypothetical protein
MAKLGVGVGEEFPVDEAAPREPASETTGAERHCGRGWHRHRHGGWHFAGHVLFRLAILALLIGWVLSFFDPHDRDHLHGFYPYPHHFFFPVLGIALFLAFAWRHRSWHHRHWHDGPRGGDKEGT